MSDDPLGNALSVAPELGQMPSVASSFSDSGTGNPLDAQALVQGSSATQLPQSYANVSRHVGGHGFLGATLHWLGGAFHSAVQDVTKPIGYALNLASAPLREIQHDYRYLHDVESRHGPIAALAEGLGIGLGAYLGGPLGADAALFAESHLFYQDSYKRTQDGTKYLDPTTHRTVSLGRDIAGIVGLKPGSKPFTLVSGVSDMLGDLTFDPVQIGLGAAKAPEEVGGLLGKAAESRYGKMLIDNPDDVEKAWRTRPAFQRAMRDIAGLDAGQIATRYPRLAGGVLKPEETSLIQHLAEANTPEDVVDVFRNQLGVKDALTKKLPTLALTRIPFRQLGIAAGDYAGPGSNVVRKVQSYLPLTIDPETQKLSGVKLDPESNQGFAAVYRTFRMGMSRSQSEGLLTEYINSSPNQRIELLNNGFLEGMRALGLPESFAPGVQSEIAKATAGGKDAVYALDRFGRNLSNQVDEDGFEHSNAVFKDQTGKITLPNWESAQREIRTLKAWGKYMELTPEEQIEAGTPQPPAWARLDDWAYHRMIVPFKSMALTTGGFALRIAGGELIPNMLRLGPGEVLQGRISQSAAKVFSDVTEFRAAEAAREAVATNLGKDFTPDELPHVTAVLARLFGGEDAIADGKIGGITKILRIDPQRLDLATRNAIIGEGHLTTEAVAAERGIHDPSDSMPYKQERSLYHAASSVPMRMRTGDDFATFGREEERFTKDWGAGLNEARKDQAAQIYAREYLNGRNAGLDEATASRQAEDQVRPFLDEGSDRNLDLYKRHTMANVPGGDPHQDWAHTIGEGVKGLTHNEADVFHPDLLQAIADGKKVPQSVLEQIPEAERPLEVKGRTAMPYIGGNRLTDLIHRKALGPMIQWLSRDPIYEAELWDQYQPFLKHVENGDMTEAEATQIARNRATSNMVRFIHNPQEKTQFAVASRTLMPFFFAQQQAWARMGRLLADDPAAFRKYQLITSMFSEIGHEQKDSGGISHLVYPGSGFLGSGVPAALGMLGMPMAGSVPVHMTGELHSLDSVFPILGGGRPAFGPVVSIPMHLITNLLPESKQLEEEVLGKPGASGSVFDQLVPNTFVRNSVKAFMTHRSGFASSMMQTIQQMSYDDAQNPAVKAWTAKRDAGVDPGPYPGIVPPPDAGPMARQAFVDRVKNQTRVNFMMRAVLGAISPLAPGMEIGDVKLRDEIRADIRTHGMSVGVTTFLQKHPDATPFTVFQSENLSGGNLPATREAQAFIDAHLGLLSKYPNAGAWLIPQQGGAFDQGVYNEQVGQHLRVKKAPEQFLKDIYTAAGNHQFFEEDKPAFDAELERLKASGDTQGAKQLRADFNQYLAQRGLQNPVWWDDFQSADRDTNRKLAVDQLNKMFAAGDFPRGAFSNDIKGLVEDYQTHLAQLDTSRHDSFAAAANRAQEEDWQAYLGAVAASKPQLKPLIRKVFLSLSKVNNPAERTALEQVFS